MSERLLKGMVGVIAIAFAVDRIARHRMAPKPARPASRLWGGLAGAASNFTSTMAHAGGPPVLAYLLGRGLPRAVFVATTVYFFTIINAAKTPFYVALGLFNRDTLTISLFLAQRVPLGVRSGLRILRFTPDAIFYAFATAALGLSGVQLLASVFGQPA